MTHHPKLLLVLFLLYPCFYLKATLIYVVRVLKPKSILPAARVYKHLSLSRLHKRVQIRNRVVDAIDLSPTDAASQEAVVGSA